MRKKMSINVFRKILEFKSAGEENFYDENEHYFGPKPLWVNKDYENRGFIIKAIEIEDDWYGIKTEFFIDDMKEKTRLLNNLKVREIIPF